jgi:SagB-type dehydrogenase family enzyme
MVSLIRVFVIFFAIGAVSMAQNLKPLGLPAPDTSGGKPIMQVLKDRHSTREFSTDTLTIPILSNLLWAACGINRPESGMRTAPSAMNKQEIELYLATAHGLFKYDPKNHQLLPLFPTDLRAQTGGQDFVKDVPLDIIYVADYSKVAGSSDNDKNSYAFADAAFIAENVYLFCSSEGLATVVRGSVDRAALEKAMKLDPGQHVILAQSVGYPKH